MGPVSNDLCLCNKEEDLRHKLMFTHWNMVVVSVWEIDVRPVLIRKVQSLKAFGARGLLPLDF